MDKILKKTTNKKDIPNKKRRSLSSQFIKPVSQKISRNTPKSEIGISVEKAFEFHTHYGNNEDEFPIKNSKPFTDLAPKEGRSIFLLKCKECSKICNFSNNNKDIQSKILKSNLLKQLIGVFQIPHINRSITVDLMKQFYQMVSINLFRVFPSIRYHINGDFRDQYQDSAWSHISLVYEALQSSFQCPATVDISIFFANNIILNTLSPDDRERPLAFNILTTLYSKYQNLRIPIKNYIINLLNSKKCTSELLSFLYGIISTFQTPLSLENRQFFSKTLLPLHLLSNFSNFHKILIQCIIKIISKFEVLIGETLNYFFKHWPISDREKQLLFLREMEELIRTFDSKNAPLQYQNFFKFISNCSNDFNFSISDFSIEVIQNPLFHEFFKNNSNILMFYFVSNLSFASKEHWDKVIRDQALNTLSLIENFDPLQFKRSLEALPMMKNRKNALLAVCKNNWQNVFDLGKKNYNVIENLNLNLLK